jgi:SSS family solute:Na+ symporter
MGLRGKYRLAHTPKRLVSCRKNNHTFAEDQFGVFQGASRAHGWVHTARTSNAEKRRNSHRPEDFAKNSLLPALLAKGRLQGRFLPVLTFALFRLFACLIIISGIAHVPLCGASTSQPAISAEEYFHTTSEKMLSLPERAFLVGWGSENSSERPIVLVRAEISSHAGMQILKAIEADWNEVTLDHEFEKIVSNKWTEKGWGLAGLEKSGDKSIILISSSDNRAEVRRLAPLPGDFSEVSFTVINSDLFLIGTGEGETGFYRFNLSGNALGWESLTSEGLPSGLEKSEIEGISNGVLLVGMAPDDDGRYQKVAFYWTQFRGWEKRGTPPALLQEGFSLEVGDSSLIVLSEEPGARYSFLYNSITDRWVPLLWAPDAKDVLFARSIGSDKYQILTPDSIIDFQLRRQATPYGWADHTVVIGFMGIMLCIGFYFSNKEKSNADYFRAGKKVPFWASGLSMFATGASAISLMAMPGMAFSRDLAYLSISIYVLVWLSIVLFVYVPLARRLNVSTANEYLEHRYGLSLRLFGSVIYSMNQLLARLAAIMLLPAIAISSIMGVPMTTSIIIMGAITTIYSTLGGLAGVIWTDVIQAIAMVLAVFICGAWAFSMMDIPLPEAFAVLNSRDKLHMFNPAWNLLEPTIYVLAMNTLATSLGMIGDQNFIQRVQCTATERDAKKAVLTQMSVAVPINVVLFSLGTVLFLFYYSHPEKLGPGIKADGIFPFFAAQNLPPGLAGLVVAALFAATMSTLSSAMNSVANIGVEDFFRRLKKNPPTERQCVTIGRFLTLSLGAAGTGIALWLSQSNLGSVWDLAIMLTGMVLAPITGFFLLGIFTTRATTASAVCGAACAIAAAYYFRNYTDLHHFLYLPIGVFTCFSVGYITSFLLPTQKKDLRGLTIYTLYK